MNNYEYAERAIDEAIATGDVGAIVRITFDTEAPSPEQFAWTEKPLRRLAVCRIISVAMGYCGHLPALQE